ncbi:hypothetical protein PG993_014570 [Apiospora rasikravindrae]|uniref:DUF3752 domain-containing protein n=1 Tax=Apiospora rasikravindrae TaxID=990691 RepID=A0ABR1RN24_9PEZI
MSSIGPQLPPHLAKRKRSVDEDEREAGSPPSKVHATGPQLPSNQDEIALGDDDDSSDDDDAYGPTMPKATAVQQGNSSNPSIGPAMPASIGPTMPSTTASIGPAAPPPSIEPSTGPTNTDEIDLADSDDEDDASHGPAPPPPSVPQPKRIQGPAPPPASLAERPPNPPDSDSDDDSDDDYGPALPTSSAHQARQSQAAAALHSARQAAESTAPQRDGWMLAPPTGDELNHAQDPTKLRARKFNSGPRASTSGGGEISSIWTETPEQKRKRLEDAVLGRSGANSGAGSSSSSAQPQPPKTLEEEERAERIRNNIQKARGPSLLEAHQRGDGKGNARAAEEEEDDPSKRAFDREKDMKLGGRIGNAQRNELLKKSANFGDRFSKGKYL